MPPITRSTYEVMGAAEALIALSRGKPSSVILNQSTTHAIQKPKSYIKPPTIREGVVTRSQSRRRFRKVRFDFDFELEN